MHIPGQISLRSRPGDGGAPPSPPGFLVPLTSQPPSPGPSALLFLSLWIKFAIFIISYLGSVCLTWHWCAWISVTTVWLNNTSFSTCFTFHLQQYITCEWPHQAQSSLLAFQSSSHCTVTNTHHNQWPCTLSDRHTSSVIRLMRRQQST